VQSKADDAEAPLDASPTPAAVDMIRGTPRGNGGTNSALRMVLLPTVPTAVMLLSESHVAAVPWVEEDASGWDRGFITTTALVLLIPKGLAGVATFVDFMDFFGGLSLVGRAGWMR
jgi:CBS domain-containing protein